MRDSLSQVESHIVDDLSESLFLKNIATESKTNLGPESWSKIRVQIESALDSSVIPAYQRFAEFRDRIPACMSRTCRSLGNADGREFYLDRSDVLRRSKSLLKNCIRPDYGKTRGSREMELIKQNVEFKGTLDEFLEHLKQTVLRKNSGRTDANHSLDSSAGWTVTGTVWAPPKNPQDSGKFLRMAPQTTAASWPPATDGTRGGVYYLNTYNLSSRPLYQLEALSLHEAVPGHHLQLAIQAELQDLHPISRESNNTAFIEGWALYSERLGKEIGFYKDPYQDFGRLSMEAWRASRLVVDTGIHWMGWSRQRAIDYMTANTALSPHNIVAEVDRYIGWPGQALAYKTGELAISRLRQEAEQKLGGNFDVRSFHDRVLEAGSIPLPHSKNDQIMVGINLKHTIQIARLETGNGD